MRIEELHIGTREEIIAHINNSPNCYRPAGDLTLESQIDNLIVHPVSKGKFGAVFMLGDNPQGGFNIDKFWVYVLPISDAEAKEELLKTLNGLATAKEMKSFGL